MSTHCKSQIYLGFLTTFIFLISVIPCCINTIQYNTIQYNTIQYFIDTPLVGLFSDNIREKKSNLKTVYNSFKNAKKAVKMQYYSIHKIIIKKYVYIIQYYQYKLNA